MSVKCGLCKLVGSVFQMTLISGHIKLSTIISDGVDFIRDVIALMCVIAAVIAVAFDGKVYRIGRKINLVAEDAFLHTGVSH